MAAPALLSDDGRRFRPAAVRKFLAGLERRTRTMPAAVVADTTAALALARRLRDDALRARLLRARGHALRALARYPAALTDYRNAVTLYERRGERDEAAKSRIGLIDALMYLGRYEQARGEAEKARAHFEAVGDHARRARVETNLGNLYHRRDQHEEALAWYDRARAEFARQADSGAQALVDYNRGNALGMLGRTDEARAAFLAARGVYAAERLPARVVQVDYGLAYLPYLENRLPEALEALAAVRVRLLEQGDRRHGSLCRLDEAEILLRLNLWDDAALAAADALEGFEALGMNYEAAKARTFMGAASYRRGDLALAARELKAARRRFLAEPNEIWGGETELGLARLSIERGQWGHASLWAHQARRRLLPAAWNDGAGRAWLLQAAAARGAGRRAQARSFVTRALDEATRRGSGWLTAEAAEMAGLLALDRKDAVAARDHFESAIHAVEGLRALLVGDDFRTAFHRQREGAYLSLARLELEEGRPAEAFRALERGRARALLEGLAGLRERRGGRDSATRARLRDEAERLLKELGERYHKDAIANDRLRYAASSGLGTPATQAARERLEAELARVMAQLGRNGPAAAPGAETDVASIQALLAPEEALLSWYEIDGRLGAFRIDAEGLCSFPDLASATEVAALAERLRFQWGRFRLDPELLTRHAAQLDRLARGDLGRLYDLVLRRVDPGAARRALVLVPTTAMRNLPFGALYDGARFLAQRFALAVAPSAGVFRACRLNDRFEATRSAGAADRGVGAAGRGEALLVGCADEQAPEIEAEIDELARRFGSARVLNGAGATVAEFRAAATEAGLIHIASHGVFRSDRPNLSGLRLSDRWLYGYDVTALPLRARLVTLSACRSGQSAAWGGGEWLGLARSFLAAGASRVLAGLWDLDDAATRRLMNLFYEKWLRDGQAVAQALSSAQSELAAEGCHPYYWSGLALVGDL